MDSKTRVLTAFSHAVPDRVPINYLYNPAIDRRLKAYFSLAPDDDEGLRERLCVDFRAIDAPYVGRKLYEDLPGVKVDDFGRHRRWVQHEWGGYWDYCSWPLQYADEETIAHWKLPSADDYDYSEIARLSKHYGKYCVVVGHPGVGDIINSMGMLRTMEQVLVDLVTDDPAGLLLIERNTALWLQIMERILEAGKGRIDLFWMGEDLGTQRGATIGPDVYRKHLRPRHQQFVDLAKSYGIPVMIHSCGSSSWAFNDFIEMGISVVDTLQPEAFEMEPAYLKRTYGTRLSFHGMISTAGELAFGKPEQVSEIVRHTLDTMMPGGGYALAPTHEIQDNSPTENVVAMYDAALSFGRYR
ncbi:MAG TPA: uroporphyrinogen decarboxylase family protein [Bacteroidota bacterium]|nr:uroporphyrinogen decarboxylase family protein [Bacteroidota bacterium]